MAHSILSSGGWEAGSYSPGRPKLSGRARARIRRKATARRRQQEKKQRDSHRRLSRIPQVTSLGRGYNIRNFLVSPKELADLLDETGDEGNGPDAAAFWDDDDFAIYIDCTLSRKRQWEAYFHELCHAIHDIAEHNRGGI